MVFWEGIKIMNLKELKYGNLVIDQEIQSVAKVIEVSILAETVTVQHIDSNSTHTIEFSQVSLIPITDDFLKKFDITFNKGFINLFDNFHVIVKEGYKNVGEVHGECYYKLLTISHNEIDKWYASFRDMNGFDRLKDDLVILRDDLRYVHELQSLYYYLSGKELTLKKETK